MMKQISAETLNSFNAVLAKKAIPKTSRFYYIKWLRYYLNFCSKYKFEQSNRKSLPNFLKKLREKHQNDRQIKQASFAIVLFYEINTAVAEKKSTGNGTVISPNKTVYKYKNASWVVLYEKLDSEIKLRHYSPKTLKAYRGWLRQFQAYTKSNDSRLLSTSEVKGFLTFLAVEKKVSASSQNQAFNALLFFFRHVLKNEFGEIKDVVRAKQRRHIPVVLSREEIDAIIFRLTTPYDLIAKLLYGCGLRLNESLNLRVQDLNFETGMLTVYKGKGKKSRALPLPEKIIPELKAHLESVIKLHQKDLKSGYNGVFLEGRLGKKYKNAAKELPWQWVFPAKTITLVPETQEYRRFHLHDTHVQKAIKQAVKRAKILKRATAHTFRHSFASHLLLANYDIRTIQELMGHSDVRTTMIYTHTVKSTTIKDAKSPLDF